MIDRVTSNFKKHPNVLSAGKIGEPNLQDEKVESAPELVKSLATQLNGVQPGQNIGVQAIGTGTGTPGANEKAPSSQSAQPATEGTAPAPAPAQVNEIQKTGTDTTQATPAATTDSKAAPVDPKQESSSKKKSKKGLRKIIPF